MHKHRAVAARQSDPYPFSYCVSPSRCHPNAHGGVQFFSQCSCGAIRVKNVHGKHVEYGRWREVKGTQRPPQIRAFDLARAAVVYVRQSSAKQVRLHTGSTSHQRSLVEYALAWGWPAESIEVLDVDLGLSGTSGDRRPGWRSLLRRVAAGEIGLILAEDTSRLTRSSADFELLLRLCEETDTLLAVEDVIADHDHESGGSK